MGRARTRSRLSLRIPGESSRSMLPQRGPSVQSTIMPPPPHAPPALLPEELVEEVLVRLPPDDPRGHVRAAIVCKSWCSVISGPGFRRRFREFHGRPPMLGFFMNQASSAASRHVSRFVGTSSTCPPFADCNHWKVMDARHGRVLLHNWTKDLEMPFIVWDPITEHWRELPLLPETLRPQRWNVAVLCAASLGGTCDHFDCHRGHFLVVLVATRSNLTTVAYVYSSETHAWREPICSVQFPYYCVTSAPSALVGNALYFSGWNYTNLLKFDLGTLEISLIHQPANLRGCMVTMTMEGGGLGFAAVENTTLYLWSWEASHDQDARWAERRSIELKSSSLPACCEPTSPYVIGSADSTGLVFLHADEGILAFDLNSSRVMKVWNESRHGAIFPYLSFYAPAFVASTGEGPRAGIPNA